MADAQLPQFLNCPTTIIKLVNASGLDAVVTWDLLEVIDNVGVDFSTLERSHKSGDTFPFGGPTTVTVSVKDVNGNGQFCSFTVTVSGKNSPSEIDRPLKLPTRLASQGINYTVVYKTELRQYHSKNGSIQAENYKTKLSPTGYKILKNTN